MTRSSISARGTTWTTAAAVALVTTIAFIAASRANRSEGAANALTAAGHSISGNVVDANGKPAASVPVRLLQKKNPVRGPSVRPPGASPTGDASIGTPAPNELQKGGPGGPMHNETTVKQTTTDAAGHFAFADVLPGKYNVMAGVGKAAVRQEDIDIMSSDPAPLSLKLNPQ